VIRDTAGMKRQVYNISESIELSHVCHMDSKACNHPVEHEWFKATTSTMVPTAGHSCTNLVSSPDPQLGSIRSACTEGLGTRLVLILFKTTRLKQPLVYNGQKILVPWVTITTDIRFEIIKVVTQVLMEDTKYLRMNLLLLISSKCSRYLDRLAPVSGYKCICVQASM